MITGCFDFIGKIGYLEQKLRLQFVMDEFTLEKEKLDQRLF